MIPSTNVSIEDKSGKEINYANYYDRDFIPPSSNPKRTIMDKRGISIFEVPLEPEDNWYIRKK